MFIQNWPLRLQSRFLTSRILYVFRFLCMNEYGLMANPEDGLRNFLWQNSTDRLPWKKICFHIKKLKNIIHTYSNRKNVYLNYLKPLIVINISNVIILNS